jgi:hypothetical protein
MIVCREELVLKSEEVTTDKIKFHNRDLREVYTSPNLIPIRKSTKYVGV